MRWQSQTDITSAQPISLTFSRVNLKYMVIFFAQLVHAGLLLADITSMPQNPTFSRYLTWLGDFNFIRHMPMLSMQGIWIRQMFNADILRPFYFDN